MRPCSIFKIVELKVEETKIAEFVRGISGCEQMNCSGKGGALLSVVSDKRQTFYRYRRGVNNRNQRDGGFSVDGQRGGLGTVADKTVTRRQLHECPIRCAPPAGDDIA